MSAETVPAIERANQLLTWLDGDEGRRALALRPDLAAVTVASAQVHATLALVEQQRLANIIALAHVADTSDAAVSPLEQTAWEAIGFRGSGEMRPEIREALGLS